MTIHQNSARAFAELEASGALSAQERRAIAEVVRRGPGTSRELDERIGHGGRAWQPTYYRLEQRGVFTVISSRPCGVSGHIAMVYDYTGVTTATKLAARPKRPQPSKIVAFLQSTPVPADASAAAVRAWLIWRYGGTT